jgi:D-apiose dehydrogenase
VTAGPTRVGVVGAGFWAGFQLAAWAEHPDAHVVAICNRSAPRAIALAQRFDIPAVYDDLDAMLDQGALDVVDIITAPDSHAALIRAVADRGVPVICQKPLAPDLDTARASATYCADRNVPLLVHENFRWQQPVRELAAALRHGAVGRPFRARIEFTTGFPVFRNQPFLRDLPRFILSDVGVHVLDVARFLFGEATALSARTQSIQPGIAGEDVATVLLTMADDITVSCELSFATLLEHDPFPEMLIRVEGTDGTLELRAPHLLRLTDRTGTMTRDVGAQPWSWVDPAYAVAQSAMVPCIGDLLGHIRGDRVAETTAADNLRTLELVEACYVSAAAGGRLVS